MRKGAYPTSLTRPFFSVAITVNRICLERYVYLVSIIIILLRLSVFILNTVKARANLTTVNYAFSLNTCSGWN